MYDRSSKISTKQLNLEVIDGIWENKPEKVLTFLKKGANPDYTDDHSKNFLHHACSVDKNVNIDIVNTLIKYKVNVNHVDEKKKSCLFYLDLKKENVKEVITVLFEKGLNPNHQDHRSQPFIFDVCEAIEDNKKNNYNNKNEHNKFLNIYKLALMYGFDAAPPVERPWFQVPVPSIHTRQFHQYDFILFSLLYRRQDHENFIDNTGYFNLIATSSTPKINIAKPSGKLLQFIWDGKDENEKEHRRVTVKHGLFNAMINQVYINSVGLLSKDKTNSIAAFFCVCKRIDKKLAPPKFVLRKILNETFNFTIDFMSKPYLTMDLANDVIKNYRSPKEVANNKRELESGTIAYN